MNNANHTLISNKYSRLSKQGGVVLLVSLVFLVALTAVAGALMQNTTTDIKMSGASEEKVVATQAAISAVDETIDNQLNIQPVNVFTQALNDIPDYTSAQLLPATTKTKATASADVINNPLYEEYACPRSSVASSVGIIECNFLQLRVQRLYGRGNTSNVVIDANIAQQLLKNN